MTKNESWSNWSKRKSGKMRLFDQVIAWNRKENEVVLVFKDAEDDLHWTIIIREDKTMNIHVTKEGPPKVHETVFEGKAEDFGKKTLEVFPRLLRILEEPTDEKFTNCLVFIPRTPLSDQEFIQQTGIIRGKRFEWSKKVLDTIPEEGLQRSLETTYKIVDMKQALKMDFERAFVLHPKQGYIGYLIRRDDKILFLDEEKAQSVLKSWFNSISE